MLTVDIGWSGTGSELRSAFEANYVIAVTWIGQTPGSLDGIQTQFLGPQDIGEGIVRDAAKA